MEDQYRENSHKNGNGGFASGLIIGMAIIIALVGIVFRIYLLFSGVTLGLGSGNAKQTIEKKLGTIEDLIDRYYIREMDPEAEAEGIYAGAVESLGDIYSQYYTAEEMQDLMEDSEGKFCGIGCYISYNEEMGYSYIASVIPG